MSDAAGYTDAVTRAAQQVPDSVPVELLDERCDRCGARAAHRVELHAGPLFFCPHHRRQHADALAKAVKVTPPSS